MLTTYYRYEIYQYEDNLFTASVDGWSYDFSTLQDAKLFIKEWVA